MTKDELIELITEKLADAKRDMADCRSAGVNSAGFNQALGAYDALDALLMEEESDQ